jgi:hypothetical protein
MICDSDEILNSDRVFGLECTLGSEYILGSEWTIGSECIFGSNGILDSNGVFSSKCTFGSEWTIGSECILGSDYTAHTLQSIFFSLFASGVSSCRLRKMENRDRDRGIFITKPHSVVCKTFTITNDPTPDPVSPIP